MKKVVPILLMFTVLLACKKEDKTVYPSTENSATTGAVQKNFSKKFLSNCPADFIISISNLSNGSDVIPAGVTPISGCSSGVILNLKTEISYKFTIGKTSTSAQVYSGNAIFQESNGVITMIVSSSVSPDGYNLSLIDVCGGGVKDIVIH
jgi:hypothetical protein